MVIMKMIRLRAMLASPAKKVNKIFRRRRTGIGSIGSSCGDPFKNDLLAQVEVGNGQRYCLAAPAVFIRLAMLWQVVSSSPYTASIKTCSLGR